MGTHRNNRPSVDKGAIAVGAATLQEAYRRIRREHGDDAVILGSRSVSRRQDGRLGHERGVEVYVQAPGGSDTLPPALSPLDATDTGLEREVRRIEELVTDLTARHVRAVASEDDLRDVPVACALLEAGAGAASVRHLLTRYRGEHGGDPADRTAFLSWLENALPAGDGHWEGFSGQHAFLGRAGSGRTELVLRTATRLQEAGRRVLVLAVMPGHRGEVRRLQTAAASGQFDAAVIQQPARLQTLADQFAAYDAVLVDLPGLDDAAMAPSGKIHAWLAANDTSHRHLVLPLDGDAFDLIDLAPTARAWSCDWLAVTRTDLTRRGGKLLDLDRAFGLPFSLRNGGSGSTGDFGMIDAGWLLDRVLAANDPVLASATPAAARA